jgi:hypothetical protein
VALSDYMEFEKVVQKKLVISAAITITDRISSNKQLTQCNEEELFKECFNTKQSFGNIEQPSSILCHLGVYRKGKKWISIDTDG